MPINTTYQQYGIFTIKEPIEADLIQAYKAYHIRDILSLDRDAAMRVAARIKTLGYPIKQNLFNINPGSPAGEASNLFNNILNFIPGTTQRPILIHCLAGKDRTGFAVAAWLVKTKRKSPCDAIKDVEKNIGYGTGGISEVAKKSMDRVLGCIPKDTNESIDAVMDMRDQFGQHQGGLSSSTNTDGGFWADNIGFANPGSDVNVDKYPGPIGLQARLNFLRRLIRVAKSDKIPGGLADNVRRIFDKNQMEMGKKVEMEHTNNPEIAKEIARDHLVEDDKYYDKLKEVESDKNDAFLGGGPPGSPTAEALPLGLIPGYIEHAEKRKKRREKLLKILERIEGEKLPHQPQGLSNVGLSKTYDGGQISNTFNAPSGAPGAPNSASNAEPTGYVQL